MGLVLLNIYITMAYFYREAREASSPAEESLSTKNRDDEVHLNTEVQLDESERAPQVYQPTKAWPFEDMDHLIQKLLPHKFWGPNVSIDSNGRVDFVGATYTNAQPGEDWRASYEYHNQLVEKTGCNLLQVPFLAHQDARCISYLTNVTNWRALKPLAMGFDQRTIKFEVEFEAVYLDGGAQPIPLSIGSILKVPQRLFPNEAFSEVASFVADRVMHIRRIPPTGWVCIPVSMLRTSVERYGSTVETVDEFLEESKARNYTEWIEKDLFEYVQRGKGFGTDDSGAQCIGASIQLKVADVSHLLDSALKIPYTPHNESWFRFLDLAHHHNDRDLPLFYKEKFAPSILHISELNAFDFIIGNGDRSPNKNNFVVGGCVRTRECGNRDHQSLYLRHPNHPTYVHLDQGMGFYGSPRRNPIADAVNAHKKDSKQDDTFCLFRAPLVNRVTQLHEVVSGEGRDAVSRFEQLMLAKLPDGVRDFVTPHVLKQCHDRMTKLLHLVHRCTKLENERIRRFVIAP
jgi:hypothetical protein